ncbi:MAG: glucose sorbosone dehydrogenase [Actinomycetota bacterium]
MCQSITRVGPSAAIAVAVIAGACGGSDPAPVAGVEATDGVVVEVLVTGLDGPTQLADHPDGRLLLGELAGGESEGVGRVVAIDLDTVAAENEVGREVLVDGLLKPTGVAAVGDELWIMEERTLSRGPLDGSGARTIVLDDLPFNGRSESTLTPTGDGTLLYATSGSLAGGQVRAGSGVLWEHDPATGSTPISAGFKNAYGHAIGPDGRLWATEVSDGSFDGEPAPDELVAVSPGVDHGWPACIGDRTPVVEFGGDGAICGDGPGSQAVFDPGATPTSVAIAPWDPDLLVVALWLERRIVTVPTDPAGAPHEPIDLLTDDGSEGFRPQHLLADGDRLLVVDFEGERILGLTSDGG